MNITEISCGRWPGILTNAFGVDPFILSGKAFPCPFAGCGGKDRFRFDDKNGSGSFFCNVCGSGNGFEFVKNLIGCDFPEAAQRVQDYLNEEEPKKRFKPEVSELQGKRAKVELEQAGEAVRLLHCQPGPITRTPTGTVVVIEKLRGTAKRYPRRPGEPKRAPLGQGG